MLNCSSLSKWQGSRSEWWADVVFYNNEKTDNNKHKTSFKKHSSISDLHVSPAAHPAGEEAELMAGCWSETWARNSTTALRVLASARASSQ